MEVPKVSKLKSLIHKLTTNIDHTLDLLKSADDAVLEQALTSLLAYLEESQKNASILYKKDIVVHFNSLLKRINTKNLVLMLKVLLRVMQDVPECLDQVIHEKNTLILQEINEIFLTNDDEMVQELSACILSNVRMDARAARRLITPTVISTILVRLQRDEVDTLTFRLIQYLQSLLIAKNAKNIFINHDDLPVEVIFHYTKISSYGIQDIVFDIFDLVTSWKSFGVQKLLRRSNVIEYMLNYIMDDDHNLLHDRAFKFIYDCCKSDETASYFIKGNEFMNFRQWSTKCEDKYIFFSAAFMTLLTSRSETREILLHSEIDSTVLSYLRSKDNPTFYKNCQMLSNLIRSVNCPLRIINDVVLCYLLEMLQRNDPELLIYHEMAIKTLSLFLIYHVESLTVFLRNNGIDIFYEALKNWEKFTNDGLTSVMKLIYVLCTSTTFDFVLDHNLYKIVIQCFSKSSVELSKQALLILDIYLSEDDFVTNFLEFNGPKYLVKKLQFIVNDDFYRSILSFILCLISIDGLGNYLLFRTNLFRILRSCSKAVLDRFSTVRQVMHLLCELHLELKFHQYGYLPPDVVCDNGFYIINDIRGFCFIENMLENHASPFYTMYVVNFAGPSIIEDNIEKKPTEVIPVASKHSGCMSCSLSTNIRTRIFCSLCDEKVDEGSSTVLTGSSKFEKSAYFYGCNLKELNYGTISPDPFLRKHLENLTDTMANSDLVAKIGKLARYVATIIREPISIHEFTDHLMQLKIILGTSMIPIGYIRCGYECERSLLFKALADKLNLSVSLKKDMSQRITGDFMYWNEITDEHNDNYIIDLMNNIGDLIKVGHPKAYAYCSMIRQQ